MYICLMFQGFQAYQILHSLIYLHILTSDETPPPTKLKLTLKGKSKQFYKEICGIYTLAPSLMNSCPHWQHTTNNSSIWLRCDEGFTNRWVIGNFDDIELEFSIAGPDNEFEWPHLLAKHWEYFNKKSWIKIKAGSTIVLTDCSR